MNEKIVTVRAYVRADTVSSHSKKYTHLSAVTMRQVYIHKKSGWNMCDKSNQMMLNKMVGPGHASEINMMASQMRGLKMEDEFQQDYE